MLPAAEFVTAVVRWAAAIVDPVRAPGALGLLAFEAGSLLTFKPVDPIQGGRRLR